ncbi:uncharacterized protein L3040_003846 [Drepanopeziza brunnea f. sp. 'multigermtubi']|uniref:Uncharacterized protein n=1 Tax=Marssonina brunnea f. sp. multigermtubi (strain MB_m1) TaxID=1072389 RepID=K1WRC1_MARBU|nr:uncharacterized protein MBM_06718 [Drepanopeziza brunnea f. sp. 'multigermtubi' MB_m1]EKD14957.1 hypothetical protein MBM_06718 [Drepanopeziza brunnea f. sp. 'multigermtubi' MB_m1]KAJ5046607.1 hypothetical protein L3040_003846 [Drepanopeziza brunnea f. sp. 'multigermtubi']
MFSINKGLQKQNLPKLKDVHEFWVLDPQGRLISNFFASLDPLPPTSPDLNTAEAGDQRENSQLGGSNCPSDRFTDPGNETLMNITNLISCSTRSLKISQENIKRQQGRIPTFDEEHEIRGTIPVSTIRTYCLQRSFVTKFSEFEPLSGLTALDFLRDLEFSRRDHLRAVGKRLSLTMHNWRTALIDEDKALEWMERAQARDMKAQTLYADLFVNLRIWIMIATLVDEDFYEANALAMLNTLFPPVVNETPDASFDPNTLLELRSKYFEYLHDMRTGSTKISETLDMYHKPSHLRSWFRVRETVDEYLNVAEAMIEGVRGINNVKDMVVLGTKVPVLNPTEVAANPSPKTTKAPRKMLSMINFRPGRHASSQTVSGTNLEGLYPTTLYSHSTADVQLTKQPQLGQSTGNLGGIHKSRIDAKVDSNTNKTTSAATQPKIDPAALAHAERSLTSPVAYHPKDDSASSTRNRAPTLKYLGFIPPIDAPERLSERAFALDPATPSPESGPFEVHSRLPTETSVEGIGRYNSISQPRRPRTSKEVVSTLGNSPNRGKLRRSSLLRSMESLHTTPTIPRSPLESVEENTQVLTTSVDLDTPESGKSLRKPSPRLDTAGPPPDVPLPPKPWNSPEQSLVSASKQVDRGRKSVSEKSDGADSVVVNKVVSNVTAPASAATPLASSPPNIAYPRQRVLSLDYQYQRADPPRPVPRNDNYEFLNHDPYFIPLDTTTRAPTLKKKGSLSSLFVRHKSSASSIKEEFGRGNPLGIFSKIKNSSSKKKGGAGQREPPPRHTPRSAGCGRLPSRDVTEEEFDFVTLWSNVTYPPRLDAYTVSPPAENEHPSTPQARSRNFSRP